MDSFLSSCYNDEERECLACYVEILKQELGSSLLQIWLYGPVVRGDMWSRSMPMHSDIEVLVLTSESVDDKALNRLLNATYPIYMECGRQISPIFYDIEDIKVPKNKERKAFIERVKREGQTIYRVKNNELADYLF